MNNSLAYFFIYVLMPIFTQFVNLWCISIYNRRVLENLYLLCTQESYECIFLYKFAITKQNAINSCR